MKKRFYTTLALKVILAMAAGIMALYAIHSAVSNAFDEITENIDRVARPNERLLALNRLFRDISRLNLSQQEEAAIGRRRPSLAFLEESKAIYETIDTLKILFDGDSIQTDRIDEIKKKLESREKLFSDFLELQYRAGTNSDINRFISKLANDITSDSNNSTTQVVQMYETTTSTTVSSDTLVGETPGFLQRLFGRRQIPEITGIVRTETTVNTETKVVIDTLEVQRGDSLFALLESSLDSLKTDQLQNLALIQSQELELLNTNSSLIQEIVDIINIVEMEEITILGNETISAFDTARETIRNLNSFTVFFILISILLIILIIIDISKSSKYRSKLELATNKARLEAEAKQRFLSNMSHEIRTPLQSIFGYTELARHQPERKAFIENIYQSAGHLLQVVNEVLDYSKVSSGNIIIDKIPFEPQSEIKSVVTAMHPLAEKKRLKLIYEFHSERTVSLLGDPFRLRQILFNLIGNAIKFTPVGKIKVLSSMKLSKKKAHLSINVIDQGVGINERQLPHLFEEYSGTDQEISGSKGGTGLGLSIVNKIIEAQNGTIEVSSTPDKGTCFTVTIPYDINDKEKDIPLKQISRKEVPAIRAKMVMIADDDPHILNISAAILKRAGIPHQTFSRGQDLLNAFNEKPCDVVFLDIRMPELNGLEVCRKIRKSKNTGIKPRIIALTAQALPDEQQLLLNNGFDGLIIKPFKEAEMLEILNNSSEKITHFSTPLKIDNLLKMTGDDKQQVKYILETVIKESRNDLGAIKKYIDRDQFENLILVVHRMAGRAGQTGADIYADRLRNLERELLNGTKAGQIENQVNEVLKEGDYFIRDVKAFMDEIAQ